MENLKWRKGKQEEGGKRSFLFMQQPTWWRLLDFTTVTVCLWHWGRKKVTCCCYTEWKERIVVYSFLLSLFSSLSLSSWPNSQWGKMALSLDTDGPTDWLTDLTDELNPFFLLLLQHKVLEEDWKRKSDPDCPGEIVCTQSKKSNRRRKKRWKGNDKKRGRRRIRRGRGEKRKGKHTRTCIDIYIVTTSIHDEMELESSKRKHWSGEQKKTGT